MGKKRTSKIWFVGTEQLKELVKNSKTYKQILSHFDLPNRGNNFRTLKRRIFEENIDDQHIQENKLNHRKQIQQPIPLEKVLVENSTYSNGVLKKRLLKNELLKNVCYECGQLPEWNGKPLVLQLDHINGNHKDNRLENLRMLCPHCHSQTPTFAGKSRRKKIPNPEWRTQDRVNARKVIRPTKEDLENLIREYKYGAWTKIGKQYGVSDNAVRKWAKKYKYNGV